MKREQTSEEQQAIAELADSFAELRLDSIRVGLAALRAAPPARRQIAVRSMRLSAIKLRRREKTVQARGLTALSRLVRSMKT